MGPGSRGSDRAGAGLRVWGQMPGRSREGSHGKDKRGLPIRGTVL